MELTHVVNVIPMEEERALQNLRPDLLASVFAFLSRMELFELKTVSTNWNVAVMEGRFLWRELVVRQDWID